MEKNSILNEMEINIDKLNKSLLESEIEEDKS